MKTTTRNSIVAFLFLLVISCKKENSSVLSSSIATKSVSQDFLNDDKVLAGKTVRIGSQIWMNKNLDVSRYRNGDKIPQVKNPAAWAALSTGAWCYYNNNADTGATYGKLYNWYAVNDARGLAPVGYHIPSDGEWATITTFLGGDTTVGGKMKTPGTIEAGTGLWHSLNAGATNSSGFTGLPGGLRLSNGTFYYIGFNCYMWISTENSNNVDAWYRNLSYDNGYLYRTFLSKNFGYSVRCIKD